MATLKDIQDIANFTIGYTIYSDDQKLADLCKATEEKKPE